MKCNHVVAILGGKSVKAKDWDNELNLFQCHIKLFRKANKISPYPGLISLNNQCSNCGAKISWDDYNFTVENKV